MKAFLSALVWFLLLVPARVSSQENAARRHERLVEHLKKTAAKISSRSLLDIRTLEDWKEKRPSVRRELLYMLGLDPLPERTPLKAEVKGTLERAEYRVEKVVYQSGRKDPDFPPDGYHEVFRRLKKIYDLYGESDRVREVDDAWVMTTSRFSARKQGSG